MSGINVTGNIRWHGLKGGILLLLVSIAVWLCPVITAKADGVVLKQIDADTYEFDGTDVLIDWVNAGGGMVNNPILRSGITVMIREDQTVTFEQTLMVECTLINYGKIIGADGEGSNRPMIQIQNGGALINHGEVSCDELILSNERRNNQDGSCSLENDNTIDCSTLNIPYSGDGITLSNDGLITVMETIKGNGVSSAQVSGDGYIVADTIETDSTHGADEAVIAAFKQKMNVVTQETYTQKQEEILSKIFPQRYSKAVSPAGSKASDSKGEEGKEASAAACKHTYEWQTISEATEEEEGIEAEVCTRCGSTIHEQKIPNSALSRFLDASIERIQAASAGSTVEIKSNLWFCFNSKILDAIAEKNAKQEPVNVQISYIYQHKPYTVTIPAGYDVQSLADENGYCGFMYLLSIFGETETDTKQ